MRILTLTINPSIDKSTTVKELKAEIKLRCTEPTYEAGGGGINVSRVLKRLGTPSQALYPSGGQSGMLLNELLQKESINYHPFKCESWTRENTVVTEQESGRQYRFTYSGSISNEKDWRGILDFIQQLKVKPEIIVASGSIPKGVPDSFYAQVAKIALKIQAKFVLDTSGKGLEQALKTHSLFLIKPNLEELESLVGKKLASIQDIELASKQILQDYKLTAVVISMGAKGAILANTDGVISVESPKVKVKSIVGAGDSMLAGMVSYLTQGKSWSEILKFGVACGTATAMSEGTQLCTKKNVMRLKALLGG